MCLPCAHQNLLSLVLSAGRWIVLLTVCFVYYSVCEGEAECPDKLVSVNNSSSVECNQRCMSYSQTFSGVEFKCFQAAVDPDGNTCTLQIESEWRMFLQNSKRSSSWLPYESERYLRGFTLTNGDFFRGFGELSVVTNNCTDCSLRFKMWSSRKEYGWVVYDSFIASFYSLSLGSVVAGNVGDGMSGLRGRGLSFSDRVYASANNTAINVTEETEMMNLAARFGPWWLSPTVSTYLLSGSANSNNNKRWSAWRSGRSNLKSVQAFYKCKGK